ncbi:NAD(P)/FAD-dependent oxidoreductase [uncultured Gemmiger sp.]|uniref:NAD(P)/FAD-dependent oxidoreductase n=1 Tax=uncultured Gemmiger sp. TaxID=1623490 RepID=UPI0025DC8374|nr:NAD(P)/FAD-dependent oxidoreductase [uncultured Gemmiger sp.]
MTDVLILGGGAAGLMAAGAACAKGLRVTVVEHHPSGGGQKLLITGKGRCNVTSDSDVREFLPFVRHNGRFLYSSLYAFPPSAAMALFEQLGVPLKTERGRRVFPQSDRAADVLAALRDYARDAEFVRGSAEKLLLENGVCCGAVTDHGQKLRAKATILATGGISYPATGSDGSGYKLARQAGHTIVPPQPSLCSLVSPDPDCPRMMGLALRNVGLTLLCDGKPLFAEQGEALFTHFGLSGPLVLSASTYIEDITKHRYICEFDLKPALDEKTLYDRITRDFAAQGGQSVQGAIAKLLPNSMRPVAVQRWGINPATRAAQVTKEQKQALVQLIKHWQVPVTALGDKEHAVITAGGVDVKEVDPKTMQSKLCPGLYFAGEVLDVDARTGGYNLQIAWSTAQAAARGIE